MLKSALFGIGLVAAATQQPGRAIIFIIQVIAPELQLSVWDTLRTTGRPITRTITLDQPTAQHRPTRTPVYTRARTQTALAMGE
jgi:hypothetical protein